MSENILVSACLLGISCRYDAKSVPCEKVIALKEKYNLIPFCPEIYGGLPTPRSSAEIVNDKVITKARTDVTEQYHRGAELALEMCRLFGCTVAILKERSPSCGFGEVYDGTFSRKLVAGNGCTAKLLCENGITVFTETQTENLLFCKKLKNKF